MRNLLLFIITFIIFTSCKTTSYIASNKKFSAYIQKNPAQAKTLIGVAVYDMDKGKYLLAYNYDKYFTPASTTKLFTFYAGLKILGNTPNQQVPALQYIQRTDSLIIFGTGDPTFLHPDFAHDAVFDFLKNSKEKIYFSDTHWKEVHFGEGWSWDDYNEDYSPERSVLPIYGNLVTFTAQSEKNLNTQPKYFERFTKEDKNLGEGLFVQRKLRENDFTYTLQKVQKTQYQEVPFITSSMLTAQLLSDTLKKEVKLIQYPYQKSAVKVLKGFQADSLYRRMLQPSDNFLAEQILLMCSSQIGEGVISTQNAIDFMLKNHLADLSDKPKWVDGSGLSRMNLFSPRSQVELLLKIYKEVAVSKSEEARLFSMLAIGGKAGTLRNLFKNYPPFVFAKTGSLSNNSCLSGYLITRSGRRLCFAFMNNHFMQATSTIRAEMEKILTNFYLNY
ncbi:D-alanyl-D-alanine carboxypeptidase/D-alanyl-D-alanine-endopeptidase [Thermoflexibacter ruber]|uniref:D-alanyl-D-alanine carboxypeptidase / D-alanyl-D-alanine-endopeptidase (Penicillin-binding protein 4) n=1 Tax=Thermoflexibacter ruber TaxID=1003 RepID=A0A1I2D1U3_9BACT|nr:D-alanyl-D-alanine carboxypeptidase [Thermoflexibacter ruber]SFE74469.1 D-alanyl-D-alanine carboxypeptidase / D-alanyl-D-alanine-endopeptidase (penicillin-binding protein 4) [Thermoflexibacter ruber]